jgi:hypothetical protein
MAIKNNMIAFLIDGYIMIWDALTKIHISTIQDENKFVLLSNFNDGIIIADYNCNIKIIEPSYIKLYVACGIDLQNQNSIHKHVYTHINLCLSNPEYLKSSSINVIRELIKYGYSVTVPLQKSEMQWLPSGICDGKLKDIDFSILVHYIINWISAKDIAGNYENWLFVFKEVIKLILPTANLNVLYGSYKIICILEKYVNVYDSGSFFRENKKYDAIKYLKNLGACI